MTIDEKNALTIAAAIMHAAHTIADAIDRNGAEREHSTLRRPTTLKYAADETLCLQQDLGHIIQELETK